MSNDLQTNFEKIVSALAENAHGVQALEDIKALMREIKKQQRLALLEEYLFRSAIIWNDVKDHIWSNDDKRNENKFSLLQGDVVESTMVERIGSATSANTHDLWLVLSPDCDCVRAPFVTVAPIFSSNATEETEVKQRHKSNFSLSLGLATLKFFPISESLFGASQGNHYYADLTEPYFIRESNKNSATVHFSMKKHGWHILNAMIKHRESRAVDREEGERLRDMFIQRPPPEPS